MTSRGRFTDMELWYLAAAPATWLAHFVVLYGAAAIACTRPEPGLGNLLWPGIVATAAALGAVTIVAVRGFRAIRPPATATDSGKRSFLGELLLGIAAVSALGILVTATVPLVSGGCW